MSGLSQEKKESEAQEIEYEITREFITYEKPNQPIETVEIKYYPPGMLPRFIYLPKKEATEENITKAIKQDLEKIKARERKKVRI